MWLLVNHTKSASGQLQNTGQLQNNIVNSAMSITVNRVIISDISSKTHFKYWRITLLSKTKIMGYNARLLFIVPLSISGFELICQFWASTQNTLDRTVALNQCCIIHRKNDNGYCGSASKFEIRIKFVLASWEILKSGSYPPKKFVLFASIRALLKWWKMLFISS